MQASMHAYRLDCMATDKSNNTLVTLDVYSQLNIIANLPCDAFYT